MFYSEKHKFVYLAIPKTGSTSIRRILRDRFDAVCLRDGHDNVIPPEFKNYFTFTCVRNPFHRIVSSYFHVHRKTNQIIPVDQCWSKFHMVSMCKYLRTTYRLDHYAYPQDEEDQFIVGNEHTRLDQAIKLESLEEDFAKLPFVTERINFPNENTVQRQILLGNNKPLRIPSELIAEIPTRYHEDFERFGYEKTVPDGLKMPPVFL